MNKNNYKNTLNQILDESLLKRTWNFCRFWACFIIIFSLFELVINMDFSGNFTFDPYNYVFVIFMIIPIIVILAKSKYQSKLKYLNRFLILSLVILMYMLFKNIPLDVNFLFIHDYLLYILIIVIDLIVLVCIVEEKLVGFSQSVILFNIILAFIGLLNNFPDFSNVLACLNYVVFGGGLSIILFNARPSKGYIWMFYLDSPGSHFLRYSIFFGPILLVAFCIVFLMFNKSFVPIYSVAIIMTSFGLIVLLTITLLLSRFVIESDIAQRASLIEIENNKLFYENLIQTMDDGVIVTNKEDFIIYANNKVKEYFVDYSDFLKFIDDENLDDSEDNRDFRNIFDFIYFDNFKEDYMEAKKTLNPVFLENILIPNKELLVYVTGWVTPIIKDGLFDGAIMSILNSNDIHEKQSILEASISEKNILLAEVHHRVKNNMQIINSLLSLKSVSINNVHFQEIIKECQSRIKTMALVHENLYQNLDFSSVNIKQYIDLIVGDIQNNYATNQNIDFDVNVIDTSFQLDLVIPIGLIINEAVTNSFKYAFPNNRDGLIFIYLSEENGEYKLIIGDNGVGTNHNDLSGNDDFAKGVATNSNVNPNDDFANGIGVELIKALSLQINGNYSFDLNDGVKITIIFNGEL